MKILLPLLFAAITIGLYINAADTLLLLLVLWLIYLVFKYLV